MYNNNSSSYNIMIYEEKKYTKRKRMRANEFIIMIFLPSHMTY